jgi:RNA polymerase sigma-70 factor (ECF subfamily)
METKMNEDNLYIKRFLNGQEDGFEILVKKYQNRVLNIVYSLIGRDGESEDIAQESFLKVYHGLKSFEQKSQFSTWLYRIVLNTTYDFLRKRKNFIRPESVLETDVADGGQGPRDALLTIEKEAMIQRALENIPFKFSSAVVLKDIEGLSYLEISKVLCCSIGTVESKIYRGRQFLKEELLKLAGEAL